MKIHFVRRSMLIWNFEHHSTLKGKIFMALISDNGMSKYLWNQWKHTLCSPEMYHDDLKCFNPMLLISTTSFQRAQTSWKKWSYFIRYQISMSAQLSFELSLSKGMPR